MNGLLGYGSQILVKKSNKIGSETWQSGQRSLLFIRKSHNKWKMHIKKWISHAKISSSVTMVR